VTSKTEKEIRGSYTFYSHVGNALALWRSTRAPDAWRAHRKSHPFVPEKKEEKSDDKTEDKETESAKADSDKAAETDAAPSKESTPKTN